MLAKSSHLSSGPLLKSTCLLAMTKQGWFLLSFPGKSHMQKCKLVNFFRGQLGNISMSLGNILIFIYLAASGLSCSLEYF